jgi:hypothetical protein
MPPSALTSENSAIVMIDHAVGCLRYDLGLPPPFGPGAPPGTTFNVVVVPAY